jgi:hypothetical protein
MVRSKSKFEKPQAMGETFREKAHSTQAVGERSWCGAWQAVDQLQNTLSEPRSKWF